MKISIPIVFIADDDSSVRKGLERLIKSAEFKVETFASAEEFLQRKPYRSGPSCLVLDVRMPGLSGIDLQKELIQKDTSTSIIFITGHGNIPMSVEAMKNGAVDFLPKPFDEKELLSAIIRAIEKSDHIRKNDDERAKINCRVNTLTPREYECLRWVISGMLNKQIASKLGVTEKTVKVHRGRVMHKMQTASVAELVRLAQKCGITPPKK
ncbi:MAG: DNA-binding response regulator [Omnitrophica WOR_2 bacterium GWF2_38_59]|nr:MAG: DNA-binding response regulator [Omnitrophica WOR_2 bacterium GWF2_38_59]OGX51022.1 MAG: DNA-binding response regulator [Omnitrophica WOR_2 bacterium RIFOXYA2_FULL_38_17]OGX54312.1 MAG: DNA-binding response regulator [Omnitrophica WOR_2 bacterium RIFOXYA12_FULL_38_10]OGX56446.1 MAG: DNA-binding response regulator [Omnitrophica WOR_2 bacterium RIFOXYB2_FULL_38_16]OGX59764.1 MAG: DNA-binding response regulator [Omnitrophica WOR_2 bacterium RIFOXYC2_FULL_38_12]HBG61581.1 DNA-binding respon